MLARLCSIGLVIKLRAEWRNIFGRIYHFPWPKHGDIKHCLTFSLSVLTAYLRGEPGLVGVYWCKYYGSGGDNWSYNSCKAPVKSSPPTPNFLQSGCPSCHQPTVSEYWHWSMPECWVWVNTAVSCGWWWMMSSRDCSCDHTWYVCGQLSHRCPPVTTWRPMQRWRSKWICHFHWLI